MVGDPFFRAVYGPPAGPRQASRRRAQPYRYASLLWLGVSSARGSGMHQHRSARRAHPLFSPLCGLASGIKPLHRGEYSVLLSRVLMLRHKCHLCTRLCRARKRVMKYPGYISGTTSVGCFVAGFFRLVLRLLSLNVFDHFLRDVEQVECALDIVLFAPA